MKLKEPKNPNYAAVVVKISGIIPLEKMNNVVGTMLFSSHIIVGKDTQIGDIGLYFPAETKLSDEFLSNNNLYYHQEKNKDISKKGYFTDNGRVRTCTFAGRFKSEGFFIPLDSLSYIRSYKELKEGDVFDELDGHPICEKYIPANKKESGPTNKKQKPAVKISRIVTDQYRLHFDTLQLRRDVEKISPEDIISVSQKLHGTSFTAGKVLVKDLTWQMKISLKIPTFRTKKKWTRKIVSPLNYLSGNLIHYLSSFESKTSNYDLVYSSRKVIKNAAFNANPQHYYGIDIWGVVANELKDIIPNSFTIYGEIVGFLPSGKAIQACSEGNFDYGCLPGQHEKYIYRITFTNNQGKVFELSWPQMVEFCNRAGLKTPPLYFYGKAKDMFPELDTTNHWHENFLKALEDKFMHDQDCDMCYNKVPFEGIVVSIDSIYNKQSFKMKTFRFMSKETEQLDKGILDIETEESLEE